MLVLTFLCLVLLSVSAALIVKLVIMRRAAREISMEFLEKVSTDTNTPICLSTRDKAMRELAQAINIQLKQLNAQRRRFVRGDTELKNAVTNISHDLRTPLTAISGYLDLLDSVDKSSETERYISVIRDRTEMLKQLTEELFRYSVLTSPGYSFSEERVCVNAVLEESIAAAYSDIAGRNMALTVNIPEHRVVRTLDPYALSRVFSNIIGNAVKYSDGDLEITLTEDGRAFFSNAAASLDEVSVGRLFDRFYTVESARKSTGLGLSIAKTIMERMNGSICAVYSENRLSINISLPDDDNT